MASSSDEDWILNRNDSSTKSEILERIQSKLSQEENNSISLCQSNTSNSSSNDEEKSNLINSLEKERMKELRLLYKENSSGSNSSTSSRGRLVRQEAFDMGDEYEFGGEITLDFNNNVVNRLAGDNPEWN